MLAGLMKMLPPPDSPAYPNPDWARVENDHGIRLPADYKAFIERFGAGCIDDFLWVIDPFSSSRDLNFDKGDYFRESYAVMKAEFPSDYPRPGYPAEGHFGLGDSPKMARRWCGSSKANQTLGPSRSTVWTRERSI